MVKISMIKISLILLLSLAQPAPASSVGKTLKSAFQTIGKGIKVAFSDIGKAATAAVNAVSSDKRDIHTAACASSRGMTPASYPNCMADLTLRASQIDMYVGAGTLPIHGKEQNWAVVTNVPCSCIDEIQSYNQHPNITVLNSIHGAAQVINSTSVLLYGVPESDMNDWRSAAH